MLRFVILFTFLLGTAAEAEVIRLKNGRTLVADWVREAGDRIEYGLGDNTFAIPRALVASIEAGGAPERSRAAEEEVEAPAAPENGGLAGLPLEGALDAQALAEIEDRGNPELAAAAHFLVARREHDAGRLDRAAQHVRRALDFQPEKEGLLTHYAYLLIRLSRHAEAATYAERATRVAPGSADAFRILGFAYYGADKTQQAIEAWKRALKLRPDATLQSRLLKAERELSTEAGYDQQNSRNFVLRYEGGQSSARLRSELLRTLDHHYDDLVRELGLAPREDIVVVLYTRQAYFDVTQAPSWSGAVYDGKLRVPIGGVESVTPELSRTLRHELVHAFIHQITRGRCPSWLNEGLAMLLEPRSAARYGRSLATLFGAGAHLPLNLLEGSFTDLSAEQATVAYVQSLATVEYIRERYGMSDLVRVLQRIGEGSGTEAALRATIRSGYGELEREMGQRYGQ